MSRKGKRLSLFAGVTGTCLVLSGQAFGAAMTDTWAGANSGLWSDAGNWTGGNAPPQSGDSLSFAGTTPTESTTNDISGLSIAAITFQGGADAYTLGGTNALALAGPVANSSSNIQTISMPLTFGAAQAFTGGSGAASALAISGSVTNTATTSQTLTLAGTGTITNNLVQGGAAGSFVIATPSAANTANWTLLDSGSAVTLASGQFNILGGGTLNYGTATSAPSFTVTAVPSDHTIGNTTGTSNFNMVNGTLILKTRFNTVDGNISVSGGQLQVWNQLQNVNGAATNIGAVNVSGGLLDVRNSSGSSTTGGTLFVASRGAGTLTVSGGEARCGTLDVSRGAAAGISSGIVNLNGGLLTANLVTTASANQNAGSTGSAGVFNFNGGTLKARSTQANYITSGGTPAISLTVNVRAGGAIIDSNTFNIGTSKSLLHDPALGTTADGGLTKLSAGTLTLSGVSTYTGPTTIKGGTLALPSTTSNNNIGSSSALIVGDSPADNTAILDVTGVTTAGLFQVPSGQTLAGYGTVKGAVTLGAGSTLAPGNTIGTLTMDGTGVTAPDLSINSAANLNFELNNSLLADQVALIHGAAGDIAFNNNTINFSDLSGGTLASGAYTLFSADVAGAYSGLTTDGSGNITSGLSIGTGLSAYPGSSLQEVGNNIVLNIAGVPEPASLAMVATASLALLASRRRGKPSLRL